MALDDALADLVVHGVADFRVNVGYRLAGTACLPARDAAAPREGKRRAVVGVPGNEGYRVGVAETARSWGW